jgi:Domain of unknown function (DUF4262)
MECECCKNGMEGVHKRVTESITSHGQSVMYVAGEPGSQAFAYTIGLTEKDLPELLLIGDDVSPVKATLILNYLAGIVKARHFGFVPTEIVRLEDGSQVWVLDADDAVKDLYTAYDNYHYGQDNYSVQQVLLQPPSKATSPIYQKKLRGTRRGRR